MRRARGSISLQDTENLRYVQEMESCGFFIECQCWQQTLVEQRGVTSDVAFVQLQQPIVIVLIGSLQPCERVPAKGIIVKKT